MELKGQVTKADHIPAAKIEDEEQIFAELDAIPDAIGKVDLTGYATKEYVENKIAEFYEFMPKDDDVVLLAANWVTESEEKHSQVVHISGVTPNSQVDLTPTDEQLVIWRSKELAFTTRNSGGVVTVYAIGQKPENDYTVQVTVTEVR